MTAEPLPGLTAGPGTRAWTRQESYRALTRNGVGFLRKNLTLVVGGSLIAIIAVAAIFAGQLAPYDPLAFHYNAILAPPSNVFPLGTDNFGRDVLSRVIWGARPALVVAIAAVFVGQGIGGLWGLLSAYSGGMFDLLSQRLVDVLMVFPSLLLAMTIVAVLGGSTINVILAIAIAQCPGAVRTIRTATYGVKNAEYIQAAKAIGCSDLRVVGRHVLPNCFAPLLVLASAAWGTAILTEAALSFLGLGTPPPLPSWGGMMSGDGRTYLTQAPWMAVAPGIALSLAVLGFNLFGDAIRDALDPRLAGR